MIKVELARKLAKEANVNAVVTKFGSGIVGVQLVDTDLIYEDKFIQLLQANGFWLVPNGANYFTIGTIKEGDPVRVSSLAGIEYGLVETVNTKLGKVDIWFDNHFCSFNLDQITLLSPVEALKVGGAN